MRLWALWRLLANGNRSTAMRQGDARRRAVASSSANGFSAEVRIGLRGEANLLVRESNGGAFRINFANSEPGSSVESVVSGFVDGKPGPNAARLQKALQDIQYGIAPDTHGWLTSVR